MKYIINKLQKTNIYPYYWEFATERQNIFLKKLNNNKELTKDPILLRYKFTNSYRASDRVSQYLIKNVIYKKFDYTSKDLLFRILLFKCFNKIETWEYLETKLGDINYKSFDYNHYNKILINKKSAIYSNAYIMPAANKFNQKRKHSNHLLLLKHMMEDNLLEKVLNSRSLENLYKLLLSYPSIGKFLAFQYAIDINYSTLTDFSENDFVVAGPGALDGISKCFKNYNEFPAEYIIKYMTEIQNEEFSKYNLEFNNLWGRDLHLIDIQNLFCEVSKYTRVLFPNIPGISKRTKIKQKFEKSKSSLELFYPPKWNINQHIKN